MLTKIYVGPHFLSLSPLWWFRNLGIPNALPACLPIRAVLLDVNGVVTWKRWGHVTVSKGSAGPVPTAPLGNPKLLRDSAMF